MILFVVVKEVDLCRMDGDYDVYGRAPLLSRRGGRGIVEVIASNPREIGE